VNGLAGSQRQGAWSLCQGQDRAIRCQDVPPAVAEPVRRQGLPVDVEQFQGGGVGLEKPSFLVQQEHTLWQGLEQRGP